MMVTELLEDELNRLSSRVDENLDEEKLDFYIENYIGGSHCYPGIYSTWNDREVSVQAEPTSGSFSNGVLWNPESDEIPSVEFIDELLDLLSSRWLKASIKSEIFEELRRKL